jgi:hypothetical protein
VRTVRLVVAWLMFVGGLVGTVLSWIRIIGKEEPLIVLMLSWLALVFAGMDAIFIVQQEDK